MNKRTHFLFFSIRRNMVSILFFIFTICLVLFSKQNIVAAKNGLVLWANNAVPSLFPFFIATEFLSHTNLVNYIGKLFNKIMKPLFNVSGIGAYALTLGIISGYPVGAKIVTNFREDNLCSKEEAERLITFTNNSGPLFILGTVGIGLFYDISIGILLLITHLLSALTVGIIFRFWKYKSVINDNCTTISKSYYNKNISPPKFSDLGGIISDSITKATSTTLLIGGFVVLFSVIISILNTSKMFTLLSDLLAPVFSLFGVSKEFLEPLFSGMVELTTGVNLISQVPSKFLSINIVLCSFLLGFGGISIFLQVFSIISKSDISIKPYIIGKLLQGVIAAFYTYIALNNLKILDFNLSLVNTNHDFKNNIFILAIILCISFFVINKFKRSSKFKYNKA